MARIARIIAPGCPHHVTARGNRREPIFFEDGDQELYLDILAEQMAKARVEVWSYCLMPNHLHLILTPQDEAGMGRAMGAAHRRWAQFVNARGPSTSFGGGLLSKGGAMRVAHRGARTPVRRPLRLGGDGRGAPADRRALCGAEPGARAPRRPRTGLAVVERAGAPGG